MIYSWGRNRFFLSFILVGCVITRALLADDCSSEWENFSSKPYTQIALPDTGVTYWRYRFEVPKTSTTVLKITGRYPYSRYLNYNIYDQNTIISTASLPDYQILPDRESTNPFSPGAPRDAQMRNYTLWAGQKDVVKVTQVTPNIIEFPPFTPAKEGSADTQAIELWYRIYLPDQKADANGNVALPKIEALDASSLRPVACPANKTSFPPLWNALKKIPPKGKNGELLSFASDGHSLYANEDVRYVTSRFDFDAGPVAVMRFKVPTFPDTASGGGKFNANTQVRYWSLCIGGLNTQTSECLADKDAILKNGTVNLVIGPETLRAEAGKRKLNFLGKSTFLSPILIYRNLLTKSGFEGDIAKAPNWPPKISFDRVEPEDLAAHHFIGDYAPKGKHCSVEEFESSSCGLMLR